MERRWTLLCHAWRLCLAVVLLTPWGLFECPSIRCVLAPEGFEGYWSRGVLLLTVDHRPFGVVPCDPDGELEDVWWCPGFSR